MPQRLGLLPALFALIIAAVAIPGTPERTAAQAPPAQIALDAGTSLVSYLGPTLDVQDALTNIVGDVSAVWEFKAGDETWTLWAPALPSPLQGFPTLVFGRAYFVTIAQAATWRFAPGELPPVPAAVTLRAAGNAIVHFGDAQSISAVLDADAVWSLSGDVWTSYVRGLPGPLQSFAALQTRRAYFVFVPSDAELTFVFPEPVSADIGPDGRVLVSADGRFTLTVPAGALDETVEITIAPRSGTAPAQLRSTQLRTSQIFAGLDPLAEVAIGPPGLDFGEPVSLTYQLDNDEFAPPPAMASPSSPPALTAPRSMDS